MAVAHTFEHMSGGERFGKNLASGSEGIIEPGMLVVLASGSLCTLAGTSDIPFGIAYGLRYSVYRPTSKFFALAEPMAVVQGQGIGAWSDAFFYNSTLPTAGQTVYAYTGGLMRPAAGSHIVGYCIRVEPRIDPTGGTGTTQNVAVIRFNVNPMVAS